MYARGGVCMLGVRGVGVYARYGGVGYMLAVRVYARCEGSGVCMLGVRGVGCVC